MSNDKAEWSETDGPWLEPSGYIQYIEGHKAPQQEEISMKYYTVTAFIGKNGATGVEVERGERFATKGDAAKVALGYLEEHHLEHVDSMARDGNSVTVDERDASDDEYIETVAEYLWSFDWHDDNFDTDRTWKAIGG